MISSTLVLIVYSFVRSISERGERAMVVGYEAETLGEPLMHVALRIVALDPAFLAEHRRRVPEAAHGEVIGGRVARLRARAHVEIGELPALGAIDDQLAAEVQVIDDVE